MARSSLRPSRLLTVALCVSALGFVGSSLAEGTEPPAEARPMSGYELYMLFRDKTWQWPDGAGLMETEGRRFTAIARSGEQSSWAEGRWIVTDGGRLCFDADWHNHSGTYPDRTCFIHLLQDDTIYQRREPAGDWYVFKHAEPEPGDEFNKLVREDLVSTDLEEMRTNPRSHLQQ